MRSENYCMSDRSQKMERFDVLCTQTCNFWLVLFKPSTLRAYILASGQHVQKWAELLKIYIQSHIPMLDPRKRTFNVCLEP